MTTYYVSADSGSNSNSGTSSGAALQSLQAAANLTRPGDTVIVESGTYTSQSGGPVLSINNSGTAGAPITYEAAPGANPVINVSSSASGGIDVNANYIVVNGFQIQGDAQSLSVGQAESQGADSATTANGINIGSVGGAIVSNVQILNNTVTNMPGGGIQACYADYLTIQGNTVSGNANYSPYGESGISVYASQNSDGSTATKNFILNNTVYNNKELVPENGSGTISDGEGIIIDDNSNSQTNGVQYTGGTLVQGNVVHGNGSEGIQVGNSSNVQVLSNTTYQDVQNAGNPYEIAAIYAPNAVIENNSISPNSGVQDYQIWDSPGAYASGNNGSGSGSSGSSGATAAAPVSTGSGSSSGSGTAASTGAASPATTTAGSTITIAANTPDATVTQSQVSVVATAGSHMVYIGGWGNTVSLSGGTDTITENGSGSTYVLPAAGHGTNTFTDDILNLGDTLDLRPALAATNWNGNASTLSQYLQVTDSSQGATLAVSATAYGSATAIATIDGANTNLSGLLAHALT
jgi:hypothetical protein